LSQTPDHTDHTDGTPDFVIRHFPIIRVIRAIRDPVSWHLTQMPFNIRVYSCSFVVKT